MLPLGNQHKKDIAMTPYKSVAGALLFSVLLGPVGLLYASIWGGLFMISFTLFVIINQFYFIAFLCWLFCCILSVAAVESHNKKVVITKNK